MDIPTPLGLLKWLKEWLERIFMLKPYQTSHSKYLKRKNELLFRVLTKDIEYDLKLENKHFNNKENPCSKLVFKFPDGFEGGVLQGVVIAESGDLQHQERFHIIYMGKPLVVIKLPRMPLKDLYVFDDGVKLSIDNIFIEGEFIDRQGNINQFKTINGCPIYNEYLNGEWDYRWGIVWNLDYLSEIKSNFRHRILNKLLGQLWSLGPPRRKNRTIRRFLSDIYREVLVNGLLHEKVINVIFWLLVILRVQKT
jgi:hypothetical protein